MDTIFYILAKAVDIYLDLVSFAILGRVIMSIFTEVDGNRMYSLLCIISEPFIIPFRLVFDRLGISQDTPLDMPFLVAALSLSFLEIILPII